MKVDTDIYVEGLGEMEMQKESKWAGGDSELEGGRYKSRKSEE